MVSTPTPVARAGRLSGVSYFEQHIWPDERGFFREAFRVKDLDEALGHGLQFVQMNHSRTIRDGLRGMHAENWEKLVYVCTGHVFIALADLRPASPTFAQVETFDVTAERPLWIYIPRGVGHGYCVLSDSADYLYLVTSYYDPSDRRAVAWDDPDLAIPWPVSNPIVSERDMHNPTMRELYPGFRGR